MISGITSSLYQSQLVNQYQQMRASFQQLGADLSSGNISAAQKDFAGLTQSSASSGSSSSTATTSGSQTSVQQEMQQLDQDLQSGNVAGAQQDYASIERSLQQQHLSHGHNGHHHAEASGAAMQSSSDPLSLLTNLAATAVSAYGTGGLGGAISAGSMLSQVV